MKTKQLETEIKRQINKFLPELSLKKINFCEGTENSPEGTYIYEKNSKYHILFTEKGKITTHKETENVKEVLWEVLDIILFDIAMEYAVRNREKGKDFRRPLFQKELELYEKFGRDFESRKREEICQILQENPYHDLDIT